MTNIANRKTEVITIRATATQKARLMAKAALAGLGLSEYILSGGEAANPVDANVTTEMLEQRLGLKCYTLNMLYNEIDTPDLKNKTAKALATLDPDGLEWYGEQTPNGYVWTNTLSVKPQSSNNKALRALMADIQKETEDSQVATILDDDITTSELKTDPGYIALMLKMEQPFIARKWVDYSDQSPSQL